MRIAFERHVIGQPSPRLDNLCAVGEVVGCELEDRAEGCPCGAVRWTPATAAALIGLVAGRAAMALRAAPALRAPR